MAASAPRAFMTPKVYDPTAAERQRNLLQSSQGSKPSTASTQATVATADVDSRTRQMQDLGFEVGGDNDARLHELQEQLNEAHAKIAEMAAAAEATQQAEAKMAQKMQSFQHVNRSQSALMRAELQKSRRQLVHTQAVASCLRERAEWLHAQSPAQVLPPNLQHLPTEEEAAEEAHDLLQYQERWEKDITQLQAILLGGEARNACSGNGTSEVEALRRRVAELEATVAMQPQVASSVAGSPAASPSAASAGSAELEAARAQSDEWQKKTKKLAAAYKQLEQKKQDLEKALAEAQSALGEAAVRPVAPSQPALRPELVRAVRSALAANRAQVAELRSSVASELKQALPAMMETMLNGKVQELAALVDSGSQQWKDKYQVECDKRRKLHNLVQELRGNIRVYCRVRPLNERESGTCISFPSPGEISLYNEATASKKTWAFNEVYDPKTTQGLLFTGIRDLVVSVIDGYNVCIFAYGQTGSGKTHSMQGTPADPGIYWRTFEELFKVARERVGWKVELTGALLEIYNEEIRDLLIDPSEKNRPKLAVRQEKGKNVVPGLTLKPVSSAEEVEALLATGQQNRSVAATDMNLHSSRSHLLAQIHASMTTADNKQLSSIITLVDLAGSERLAKSGVTGDRAKEAIAINKSLSALGDVINSRATKNAHTPYRNSTLTHLLQDSLSGDSKTLMLLQINPCADYCDETLCSLQFGARVNAVELKK